LRRRVTGAPQTRLQSLLLCATALVTTVASASAQTSRPPIVTRTASSSTPAGAPLRAFLNISGGIESAAHDFSETHHETINAEDATWQADYQIKSGLALEAGGGVRLWRRLFVGATYSRYQDGRKALVNGQIPHPFQFNQPRAITGETADLSHDEQAVHISATWMLPVTGRIDLAISGGPSVFNVKRPFVESVDYTQKYPYDTATFTLARVADGSRSGVGAHGGIDVTYLLAPQIGVGGTVRFSRANLDVSTPSGGSVSLQAGGVQAAVGRIRFNGRTRPGGGATSVPRPAPAPAARTALVANAVTSAIAPVYVRAEAAGAPMARLPRGTGVRVVGTTGEWLNIQFVDAAGNVTSGYVQRMFVNLER
jgi:hypothetical protein